MVKNHSRKKRIRARMARTGESYMQAMRAMEEDYKTHGRAPRPEIRNTTAKPANTLEATVTCRSPDRHEPKLTCGYPLPCPHHSVVVVIPSAPVTDEEDPT